MDISTFAVVGAVLSSAVSIAAAFFARLRAKDATASHQKLYASVRLELRRLSNEYAELRRQMPAGGERTTSMEIVADKLRILSPLLIDDLQELTRSVEAGERLAAAIALQSQPQEQYLDWLTALLADEKPFVGYHAALALRSASRTLKGEEHEHAAIAVRKALMLLNDRRGSDRWRVLEDALPSAEER